MGGGYCSEDDVVKRIQDRVRDAEIGIRSIIDGLNHVEVTGMTVYYNHSTKGDPARIERVTEVSLHYKIV